jgi:hypothetical protein
MKNVRPSLLLLGALTLGAVARIVPATPQAQLLPVPQARVPIGAIVAWHPDLGGTPFLPPGWIPCDGQMVEDPDSPYFGELVPDLNGEARYLRGGLLSGVMQDDATAVNGLSVTVNAAGTHSHGMGSAGTHTHSRTDVGGIGSTRGFAAAGNQSGTTSTSAAGAHTHSISPAGDHIHTTALTGDSETRPTTMTVVWIIRIR